MLKNIGYAFALPARGGAAAVVVVFAIGFTLAERAGLFGLPLALILLSWTTKYAYALFDHCARGFDGTPVLDIQMINPFEQRPLGQLLIIGLILGLAELAHLYHLDSLALTVIAIGLTLLPASIAVLGLESNLIRAANPFVLFRLMRGLRWRYVIALLAMYLLVAITVVLWRQVNWPMVNYLVSLFLFFSFFSLLAFLVYDQRLDLGLEVWKSPEIDADAERKERMRQDDRLVDEAYGLFRARHHDQAWKALIDWLQMHDNQPRDFDFLCTRLKRWPDGRYYKRMCQEYIERLIELDKKSAALKIADDAMRAHSDFRPRSAASTLALARVAATGGAKTSARRLLADFDQHFSADSAQSAAAHELARTLAPDQ